MTAGGPRSAEGTGRAAAAGDTHVRGVPTRPPRPIPPPTAAYDQRGYGYAYRGDIVPVLRRLQRGRASGRPHRHEGVGRGLACYIADHMYEGINGDAWGGVNKVNRVYYWNVRPLIGKLLHEESGARSSRTRARRTRQSEEIRLGKAPRSTGSRRTQALPQDVQYNEFEVKARTRAAALKPPDEVRSHPRLPGSAALAPSCASSGRVHSH